MLEIIAMVSMLVDHIGYIFFPEERYLRYIGRLAFPIYVYSLSLGYQRTRDIKNYMKRLFIIALVSQVPYSLAFISLQLNVVFTLLVGLLILWLLDHKKWFISLPLVIVLSAFVQLCDYGIYGVVLTLIYRYSNRFTMIVFHLMLNFIYVYFLDWSKSQLYSIFGTVIIVLSPHLFRIKIHRTFFRSFYPGHLLLLFIFEIIVYGERYFNHAFKVIFK